jgi:hypothetical protein
MWVWITHTEGDQAFMVKFKATHKQRKNREILNSFQGKCHRIWAQFIRYVKMAYFESKITVG